MPDTTNPLDAEGGTAPSMHNTLGQSRAASMTAHAQGDSSGSFGRSATCCGMVPAGACSVERVLIALLLCWVLALSITTSVSRQEANGCSPVLLPSLPTASVSSQPSASATSTATALGTPTATPSPSSSPAVPVPPFDELCPAVPTVASLTGALPPALAAAVAAARAEFAVHVPGPQFPGGVLLVAQGDTILIQDEVGAANVTSGKPFTTNTLTRVGSITKTLSALLMAQAGRDGAIDLHAPIVENVTSYNPINPWDAAEATWRQLAGHSAGLPRDLPTPVGGRKSVLLGGERWQRSCQRWRKCSISAA